MNLHKELTTVTLLSKRIALIMFITLPIIAFLFGMKYQQAIYSSNQLSNFSSTITKVTPTIFPPSSITPNQINQDNTSNWKIFSNEKYSFEYPIDWEINKSSRSINDIIVKSSNQSLSVLVNLPGYGEECYQPTNTNIGSITFNNQQIQLQPIRGITNELCKNIQNSKITFGTIKNNNHYLLMFGYKTSEEIVSFEVLKKILSTFNFL
ncbi:MAG: hypothetical protein Q7R95_06740 [bacterium]|nr:hypothetical protein [bacterium]